MSRDDSSAIPALGVQVICLQTLDCNLSSASTSGSNVGWQITSAEFYQPQYARTWTTGAISVIGGSGGLRWVIQASINSALRPATPLQF